MTRNGFKLKDGSFGPNGQNKFFAVRVVRHGKMLPREAADAPSFGNVQGQENGALSNLV